MKITKIKPVPKYIVEKIKKADKQVHPKPNGNTRFYSYLTTNDRELVKVTVAVRHYRNKWYYKQCAVHGVHSEGCFAKDMVYYTICGYRTGWCSEGLTKYPKWFEDGLWEEAGDKYFDPFAPVVNVEYIAKFPEYKYSAYEIYKGVDILQYLRLYEKYPHTEYILKLGLSKYVKSKQILEKTKRDKRFCKWLAINRVELKENYYYISAVLHAYQKNKSLKEAHAYEVAKKSLCLEKSFKPIRELFNGDYQKYFDYVGKQQITNRLYLDYLNACNYLGLDMSENKNRFPHNFMYWHDVRIDEYSTAKAIKDEKERQELYTQFSLIADKYLQLQYDKGDYVAIIAKSPAELIHEGNALNHCVGRMNYEKKFIREETLIFFVRPRDLPQKPFVTVEYSLKSKKILQCYAHGNTTPDNEVTYYINNVWLPYANKALKKISA